jgi:hypothetical protein
MIFPPVSGIGRVYRFLKRGMRSVYDIAKLENDLLRSFGDATVGEARNRLVTPAFEGLARRAVNLQDAAPP